MAESSERSKEVDHFILEYMDSVSHLEALLLLWASRPRVWSAAELAARLYVTVEVTERVLRDLSRAQLIVPIAGSEREYRYESTLDQMDALIEAVDATYRREMVRISTMIHSKASSAIREFARAFRFTKERD